MPCVGASNRPRPRRSDARTTAEMRVYREQPMATEARAEPAAPGASGARSDEELREERAFVERVEALARGQRACLKRNAGNTLGEARRAKWFYYLLEGQQRGWNEEIHFLVATLMGLDPHRARG